MKKWEIHIVPHTHWDKEWYFTKQDSEVLLCNNFKEIFKTFKANKAYKSFTYDGQVSIVDEYLKYFSQDHNEIKHLAKNKQLILGPWYTQPDFFNTTSESIVRNLLVGIDICKSLDADYLKTAYVPDSFGHNAQMPQIYKLFNLHQFIYWRGISKKTLDEKGVMTKWKGIDGSTINSYNFYLGYWCLGAHFPYINLTDDADYILMAKKFLASFAPLLRELKNKTRNTGNKILLPLGGDQAPIAKNTPRFFEAVNHISKDDWVLSDYDAFFEAIKDNEKKFKSIEGELKTPYMSRIHKTIGSQRYDIKKIMKETEYLLYNGLERLATSWFKASGEYPSETIRQALKWILVSQAHDSAGGCNSDETNVDIKNRLSRAKNLVESEITRLLKNIVNSKKVGENEIVIFNPQLSKTSYDKKIKVFSRFKDFKLFDKNKRVNYFLIKQEYHNDGMIVNASAQGETVTSAPGFYSSVIKFDNLVIKPFSYKILQIKPSTEAKTSFLSNFKTLENDYYLIKINANGSLNILDKVNQVNYLNQFEIYANHDGGDSYDYSPINEQNAKISLLVKSASEIWEQDGLFTINITNVYQLPFKIDNETIATQTFNLKFEITNSSLIEMEIKTLVSSIENRWRILASTNMINKTSFANQAYSTIERDVDLQLINSCWQAEKWVEKPVAIETNESFVYLKDHKTKTGFITKGNNEYEVVNQNQLHLTLYRSVNVLGKNNLLWRPGRASGTSEFSIPATDASLINQTLKFDIVWFSLQDNQESLWLQAEQVNTPPIFYQVQNLNKLEKRFDRFLLTLTQPQNNLLENIRVTNCNLIVKAIKVSESKTAIIIRLFNASNKIQKLKLMNSSKPWYFYVCDMLEQNKTNEIFETVNLRSHEIITIKLEDN